MKFKQALLHYLGLGILTGSAAVCLAQEPAPPLPSTLRNLENPPTMAKPQSTNELINIIEGQLNTINREKYEDAYNIFTSRSFREATAYDDFRYFIESYPAFYENKNAYFGIPTFKPPLLAIVPVNLISKQGVFLKVEYYLILEDTQWRILGIKVILPPELKNENPSRKVESNDASPPKPEVINRLPATKLENTKKPNQLIKNTEKLKNR